MHQESQGKPQQGQTKIAKADAVGSNAKGPKDEKGAEADGNSGNPGDVTERITTYITQLFS